MKHPKYVSLSAIFFSVIMPLNGMCAGIVQFGSNANQFSIDFVNIGTPGNAAHAAGPYRPALVGAVKYAYSIGKYEISRDMITKANALGALGITLQDMTAYGGNSINRPATGISWNEAARFVNWLNTSQGFHPAYKFSSQPGDGAYDANHNILLWSLGEAGYSSANPFRNSLARFVLPSADEWFKAAFFDPNADGGLGNYNPYPIVDYLAMMPVGSGTTANTIVFAQPLANGPADITSAGGLSSYGTMAQGGNASEWTESEYDLINDSSSSLREARGGNWSDNSTLVLYYWSPGSGTPMNETFESGFRVASIPEPSAMYLALIAAAGGMVSTVRRRGM